MNFLRLFRRSPASAFKICSARCVSQHPLKFNESQDRWREKDDVSKNWSLIYKAPMDQILNYTSAYLTISTGVISGAAAYYAAFVFDPLDMNTPVMLSGDVVIADSAAECFTYIAAFIALHAAVKVLLSKYVIRLYQDGDNYIAVFRGHFFNSIVKYQFHLDDFKKLKPTLVVAWGDSRFSLGKKHAIILDRYFKTPEYFNYLLHKRKAEESSMND